MALQLYTAPGTIGVATHIALQESGLAFEAVKVDVASGEQLSDHYLKINSKARVPALIVDGQVLTETPAILVYVAQIASSSVLALPADPFAFAQIQSFNSYLASTVHVAHAHNKRGTRWTDNADALTAMTAFVPTSMAACFELVETQLLRGPWVMAKDSPSVIPTCLRFVSGWKVMVSIWRNSPAWPGTTPACWNAILSNMC